MKKIVRLNEDKLRQMISENVKRALNEISAKLAQNAAEKALTIGREGFGKYEDPYEIPDNSYHGKKFNQGQNFLKYRNSKLGLDDGYMIYYPNGDDSVMVLKDPNGKIVTKPCQNIEELENEYNRLKTSQNESRINKVVSESIRKTLNEKLYPVNI